jgi:hypothetical protein
MYLEDGEIQSRICLRIALAMAGSLQARRNKTSLESGVLMEVTI